MSSEIAVRVSGLSKVYHIYDRPRDRLWQMLSRGKRQFYREFWALRDVSFEIKRGENFGIVGHNGSGKSTLLQIISGTLTPTTGQATAFGKVAALLELGSGFNPEFTGRENVMLYGQILGMSAEEIAGKYDSIVQFSEIGDFIDQPLKTYSSGMYVRLAFSVAIHVDPDILIVDEALSVGDAFFQAKCMTVMKKLMDRGTTLLFVSHDASAVKTLCKRALLLDHGHMEMVGDADEVIEAYYASYVKRRQGTVASEQLDSTLVLGDDEATQHALVGAEEFAQRASFQRIRNGKATFVNVQLLDSAYQVAPQVTFNDEVVLRMVVSATDDLPALAIGYHIRDRNGFDIAYSDTGIENAHLRDLRRGQTYVVDWTLKVPIRAGNYSIAAVAAIPIDMTIGKVETCDHVPIAVQFGVTPGPYLPMHGAVRLQGHVHARLLEAGQVSV